MLSLENCRKKVKPESERFGLDDFMKGYHPQNRLCFLRRSKIHTVQYIFKEKTHVHNSGRMCVGKFFVTKGQHNERYWLFGQRRA